MPQKAQGIAALVIVVVIGVVAAGAAFFLYKQGAINIPLPGVAMRATEKDFDFIEDATLRKHMVAQANQTSYRTKSYSEAADLTFISEVQIKGENFNTRDIEMTPDGKETKHKIEIGETVYVKDMSDNAWWKQTIKPEELPTEEEEDEPVDYKAEYSKPDLQFKALGKEACGNLTCYKYQQLTGGPEGMGFTRIFWFDERKFLLRRDEVSVGEFKTIVEHSYDKINITPPSPTKDVAGGKSIYDYYYGTGAAPTQDQMPAVTPENLNLPELNLEDLTVPETPEEIGY